MAKYGDDYSGKPVCARVGPWLLLFDILWAQNDMISWLIDSAKKDQRTVRNITVRILTVNFGAIHTSVRLAPLLSHVHYITVVYRPWYAALN